MKVKYFYFEIFFLDFQLNFTTLKITNSKSIVQKPFTNGSQSHLKLQDNVQKNFFFSTLNAYIFQFV